MSNKHLQHNQSGLVSIIVAIVFITIMSLVATSFALLSRRETRQALDRQLSTQAFYAAESGVNDAIKAVRAGPTNITQCSDVNTVNPSAGAQLNDQLSYTCVLVNEKPTTLEFSPVTSEKPTIVRVLAPSEIGKLRISWQDADGSTKFASNSSFLLPQAELNTLDPDSFANHTGILRTSVIPVTGSMSRESLINTTQTLFLYPRESQTTGAIGSYGYQTGQTKQGDFVNGQCNKENNSAGTPRYCNVDITNLAGSANGPGVSEYYIRLDGIYRNASVTIQAFSDNGSTSPLTMLKGQVVIDSTGKANDVLRRIQVRVPVQTEYEAVGRALETADSICKRISYSATRVADGCAPYN
jgi:Tfp pilus assembly protein PilX